MDLPVPDPPSNILPYGQTRPAKEGFRILELIVGALFGIVAGIVCGLWVAWVVEIFAKTQSAGIMGFRVAGVGFLIATVACALTVVELRRKELWFLRGFLVGAGTLLLLFGMMFVLYK